MKKLIIGIIMVATSVYFINIQMSKMGMGLDDVVKICREAAIELEATGWMAKPNFMEKTDIKEIK